VVAKKAAPSKAAAKKASARRRRPAPAAELPSAPRSTSPLAARFGERGARLWEAHCAQVEGERGLVLLEEACRIADRLDLLDRLLKGEERLWCHLVEARDGDLEIRVDGALMEARQQANVLRQILTSLPLEGGDDDGDADSWVSKV
jgi:hypothetical protein